MGRVDRYQVVEPQRYPVCGRNYWEAKGATTRSYQVAQLVEHPISEIIGMILSTPVSECLRNSHEK
ncbi:MAG: hypothetical protein MGG11_00560 [Trichodesmium sp. MAG_R03]|nr:hypothetical protein [Trichodesmium sp. MAG_R03]